MAGNTGETEMAALHKMSDWDLMGAAESSLPLSDEFASLAYCQAWNGKAVMEAQGQIDCAEELVTEYLQVAFEDLRLAGEAIRSGNWPEVARLMERASLKVYPDDWTDLRQALDLLTEAREEGGAAGLAEARGWLV
jgi:hypothetical protein